MLTLFTTVDALVGALPQPPGLEAELLASGRAEQPPARARATVPVMTTAQITMPLPASSEPDQRAAILRAGWWRSF
jgi:hypothetical protein